MVVNHSVKLSFDLRFTRLYLKNCMLKKPITRQHKLRLSCNGASTAASIASLCFLFPKSSSILFGSPVLRDGSGWFPPRNLSARQHRSVPLCGAILLCALPPSEGVMPYLNSMYGKRVQATFTPVLLHYNISISISQ